MDIKTSSDYKGIGYAALKYRNLEKAYSCYDAYFERNHRNSEACLSKLIMMFLKESDGDEDIISKAKTALEEYTTIHRLMLDVSECIESYYSKHPDNKAMFFLKLFAFNTGCSYKSDECLDLSINYYNANDIEEKIICLIKLTELLNRRFEQIIEVVETNLPILLADGAETNGKNIIAEWYEIAVCTLISVVRYHVEYYNRLPVQEYFDQFQTLSCGIQNKKLFLKSFDQATQSLAKLLLLVGDEVYSKYYVYKGNKRIKWIINETWGTVLCNEFLYRLIRQKDLKKYAKKYRSIFSENDFLFDFETGYSKEIEISTYKVTCFHFGKGQLTKTQKMELTNAAYRKACVCTWEHNKILYCVTLVLLFLLLLNIRPESVLLCIFNIIHAIIAISLYSIYVCRVKKDMLYYEERLKFLAHNNDIIYFKKPELDESWCK